MRNNTFGVLIETWAEFAAQDSSHLNYYELVGSLFPSHPSESATSRLKSTQPLSKTLARFVSETSSVYSFEQELLIPGRIQAKLKPDVDYAALKDYVWDVLSCIADGDAGSNDEVNYLSLLIVSSYNPGIFKRDFCEKVVEEFAALTDTAFIRKLARVLSKVDDSNTYGRFELFATLFFASLGGEEALDAVIAAGIPLELSTKKSTPVMDIYGTRKPLVRSGFKIQQYEISAGTHMKTIKEWTFPESQNEVIIGREGPDIALVPPANEPWEISRHHLIISVDENGTYWAEDISLNGSAVLRGNELAPLHRTRTELKRNDTILLAAFKDKLDEGFAQAANWEHGSVIKFTLLHKPDDK